MVTECIYLIICTITVGSWWWYRLTHSKWRPFSSIEYFHIVQKFDNTVYTGKIRGWLVDIAGVALPSVRCILSLPKLVKSQVKLLPHYWYHGKKLRCHCSCWWFPRWKTTLQTCQITPIAGLPNCNTNNDINHCYYYRRFCGSIDRYRTYIVEQATCINVILSRNPTKASPWWSNRMSYMCLWRRYLSDWSVGWLR